MKKAILSLLLGSIIMTNCHVSKKKILGTYSFQGEHVIDKLTIKDDIYIHEIYNKNLKLMYKGKDKWTLDGNRITLQSFYNNEDNELEGPLSNEETKKFLMLTSFPIYKQNNEIIMEVNADENIVYKKNH